MSFNSVLHSYLETICPSVLYYGMGIAAQPPYYVMTVINDPRQGVTMCDTQLTAGEALVQFSYAGTEGPGPAEDELDSFREMVADVLGAIGSTEKYDIWQNVCGGVRALPGASAGTWDCIFEVTFSWKKL